MENVFYPTGPGTKGRTVVCMCCEDGVPMMEGQEAADAMEKKIKQWLDDNEYVVETWQMKEKMKSCGAGDYELQEMEGGGDAGGGAFASLDSTPGMGNVMPPEAGGTNADFYGGRVGSGDKFTTLTVGTPAAKKNKKKDRKVKDYKSFIAMLKDMSK